MTDGRNQTSAGSKPHRPAVIRELCERLGDGAGDELVAKFGGREISVPCRAKGSMLERELGEAVAAVLVENHAGRRLSVPKKAVTPTGVHAVVAANPDLSSNELAARLGVTARWIRYVRRELRGDA